MRRATFIILLASIALLIIGIGLGDVQRVFVNATLLCLSCIGIG